MAVWKAGNPHSKTITVKLQCKAQTVLRSSNPVHLHLQLLKEKHDNTVLIAETVKQKKLLGKYNRGMKGCIQFMWSLSIEKTVTINLT